MRELNKYFVFSDVHGEYKALQDALNEAGYDRHNPNHKLISCGDNFDRGPESAKVYRFLRDNKAICIRGNHDNFFLFPKRPQPLSLYLICLLKQAL